MSTRHLSYMPLADLRPAPYNSKDHDLVAIRESFDRFGWVEPVVVDERTALMLGGHGRREVAIAMRLQGETPPSGVFVDDDGDWLVPVLRTIETRNDDEARALVIALNSTSQAGGWIEKLLAVELEHLATTDPSLLDTTGIDNTWMDEIFRRVDPEGIGEQDPDKAKSGAPDPDPHMDLDADDHEAVTVAEMTGRTRDCPSCGFTMEV